MNRFRFLILSLTIMSVAPLLAAADASGAWAGTLSGKLPSGEERTRSAHMVLKQEGDKVTGTAGPDAERQHEITNGKVDGDTVSFEIVTGEGTAKVSMKLAGDELNGEMSLEANGMKAAMALALKRLK
jgi:hypothetical protein